MTVILISDGADPINGTPFDARISRILQNELSDAEKSEHADRDSVPRRKRGDHHQHARDFAMAPGYSGSSAAPVIAKAAVQKPAPAPEAGAVARHRRQKSRDHFQSAHGIAGARRRTCSATGNHSAANGNTRCRGENRNASAGFRTRAESGRKTEIGRAASGDRGRSNTNACRCRTA